MKFVADDLDNLSDKQVAQLLCVTDKTVRNYREKENLPSKKIGTRRVYAWPDVLGWIQSRTPVVRSAIPENYGKSSERESIASATLRKVIAEANMAELKEAQLKEELVEIAVVERTLSNVVSGAQQLLLSMPAELAPQMVGLAEMEDAQLLLDTKAREIADAWSELTGEEVLSDAD